ncbi:MAG: SRPBCC domain-containing protein [Pseudomonadota bacterium]
MKTIQKTTQVPLSPQEAFDLFIAGLDEWWPKDSHAPLGPDAKLVVEARKNGAITEVGPDGTENLWGRIIAFDAGHYLAFTWFPEDDEDAATVIAVTFIKTAEGTRLELTHGDFEILGDTADAVSQSYLIGWDLVLGTYCFVANKQLATA